jgi:hypothetical protein
VLTLRAMASRSSLHPSCERSGHIDADQPELLREGCLLFPAASLMRDLKVVALGSADSRQRLGEVLVLVGWCQ